MQQEVYESPGLIFEKDKKNDKHKQIEIPMGYEEAIKQLKMNPKQVIEKYHSIKPFIPSNTQHQHPSLKKLDSLHHQLTILNQQTSADPQSQQEIQTMFQKIDQIRTNGGIEYLKYKEIKQQKITEHNITQYLEIISKLKKIHNQTESQNSQKTETQSSQSKNKQCLDLYLYQSNQNIQQKIQLANLSILINKIQNTMDGGTWTENSSSNNSFGNSMNLIEKVEQITKVIQCLKIQNYDDYSNLIRKYMQQLEDLQLPDDYMNLEKNQFQQLSEIQHKLNHFSKTILSLSPLLSRLQCLQPIHQQTAQLISSVCQLQKLYFSLRQDNQENQQLLRFLDDRYLQNVNQINRNLERIKEKCKEKGINI